MMPFRTYSKKTITEYGGAIKENCWTDGDYIANIKKKKKNKINSKIRNVN